MAQHQEEDQHATPSLRRRLASDYLVNRIRSASEVTVRDAFVPLREPCLFEREKSCWSDMNFVQSVSQATDGGTHSLVYVDALRNVHLCLAAIGDSLSQPCLRAMIDVFASNAETDPPATPGPTAWATTMQPPPSPPSMWTATPQPSPPVWASTPPPPLPVAGAETPQPTTGNTGGRGDEDQAASHSMRHGKTRVHHVDDSRAAATPVVPSGIDVHIINTNFGVGERAVAPAIGHWGDRHHHRDVDGGVYPLVWLVVLPFFCVGVFATSKWLAVYAKARRERQPSVQYAPLRTDGASP